VGNEELWALLAVCVVAQWERREVEVAVEVGHRAAVVEVAEAGIAVKKTG
jgi:hypothetical protein